MHELADFEKIRKSLDRAESLHNFKKNAPILIAEKVESY